MSTVRALASLAVCTALAACGVPDTTGPSPTPGAPRASADVALVDESSLALVDEASSFLEVADAGASDVPVAFHAGPPPLSAGHFDLASQSGPIVDEYYSYTARGTEYPAAQGELEIHGTQINPAHTFVVHARVECMSVLGNQAWISGRAYHVLLDNQPYPALVGTTTSIRVQDNGEGARQPDDLANAVYFRQNTQAWCRLRPQVPMTPTANGNIQVM